MTAPARLSHRPLQGGLRRLLALVLVVALLPVGSSFALAGCGDDTQASKTEIALRLGLAYGAFKRYIYTPAQAGQFKSGAEGRKTAIAKAAVAGAFTARMLQKAKEEADQDPAFAAYSDKIVATIASLGGLTALLQGGTVNLSDITGGLGDLDSLVSAGEVLGIKPDLDQEISAADLVNPLK
ncbi:MAG: hypothetical protein JHD16_07160 [Solirubrobacteraceae bacterium]|nr:hypothetical protein [Solirubrobacteraceae bacterium]